MGPISPETGGLEGPDVLSSADLEGTVEVSDVKLPGMPSMSTDVSGDMPSVDVDAAAPDVNVEGGKGFIGAGIAAGAAGAAAVVGGLFGMGGGGKGDVDVSCRGSYNWALSRLPLPFFVSWVVEARGINQLV